MIRNTGRACYRLAGMVCIIVSGLVPVIWGRLFSGKDLWWAVQKRQKIALRLLRFLAIRVEMSGEPVIGNYLYVSNHQSYVDPVCIAKWIPFVPIAKAEVSSWPLIGWGARMTGIFYVKREQAASRSLARDALHQLLRNGGAGLVFPEGTTSAAWKTLPFREGAFHVAASAQKNIVPMAIAYLDDTHAWTGDDGFIPHFLRVFAQPEMRVKLHFFAPVFSTDGKELSALCQTMIDNKLEMWRL